MYTLLSLVKIIVGFIIALSVYLTIDPYVDPLIALSGAMVAIFLLGRGSSFFVFFFWKKFFKIDSSLLVLKVESYKLSLLFGIYCLINVIFLLRHQRTILGGIILLIGFIIVQALLIPED